MEDDEYFDGYGDLDRSEDLGTSEAILRDDVSCKKQCNIFISILSISTFLVN